MKPLEILIKYHADIPHIEKIEVGDWIDLRAGHSVVIEEGKSTLISLGISMKLPEGYEAHVLPRSSTFKNWGIIMTNGMGIIDNSYCGDRDIWRFPAFCLEGRQGTLDGKPCSAIEKGDRIAQFRIVKKQPGVTFKAVEMLDTASRGGFGSTGVK